MNALEKAGKQVDYYALDVSLPELERTLSQVKHDSYKHVNCFGLHGSYDDGLHWLRESKRKPTTILSLGSSIGNFARREAAEFVASFAAEFRPEDKFLIGIDSCKDPVKVYHAYNDREGLTHRFILNGLAQANRVSGTESFDVQDWKVVGQFNESKGCHQAFLVPLKDVNVFGLTITKGEEIRIEESYKYSMDEIADLWDAAGVAAGPSWFNTSADYGMSNPSRWLNCFARKWLPKSRFLKDVERPL